MSTVRLSALVATGGAIFGAATVAGTGGSTLTGVVAGALLGLYPWHARFAWLAGATLMIATVFLGSLALMPPGGDDFAPYLLVAAHSFAAAYCDQRWYGVPGAIALLIAGELNINHGGEQPGAFVFIVSATWAAGRELRTRTGLAKRLEQRAAELEEEREAHAQLSVRYERARIASELHDIVAHAISVMVIQASAGQRLVGRDPELTAETFATIAGAARQAEADIGRLAELLATDGAVGPAPDLALVEELVARAAGSGLDVTLSLEGEREGLPAPVAEAAYRVVREGLTNALRYAAGASVRVLVRGERGTLTVELVNGPGTTEPASGLAGAGTGNGLRGLRERVGACGGTLDAAPTADGGWRLCASIPLRAAALGQPAKYASEPRPATMQ